MSDMGVAASSARTFLFVPGDRPERFAKARAAAPGLVILDLEDAVAPEAKTAARDHVVEVLGGGLRAAVRVNATGTPWHDDDLEALTGLNCAVLVPKAESPALIAQIAARWPVVALVETARGVLDTASLAEVDGVVRLAFGSFDLAAELGVSPDDREAMAPARGAVVLASAAAGISQPVDGVTSNVSDLETLAEDVGYARRLGFGAKLCIHPNQVPVADRCLLPSTEELIWARTIVRAALDGGGAVVVVDGKMVDKPVIDRALRLIDAGGTP